MSKRFLIGVRFSFLFFFEKVSCYKPFDKRATNQKKKDCLNEIFSLKKADK